MSAWLSLCLKYHQLCGAPDERFIPRRLLYLGLVENSARSVGDGITIRLTESSRHFSRAAPYAGLSYCWWKDLEGVITTTKVNLDAFYVGILSTTLSQAVQDAILVCQKLGIQYL